MTHILAAVLAALSVDASFAPTIVYPPSAWTNEVRSSSVPGSVAFSNATRRIDAHASAAMFGTYDALVARQVLPYLVNYGGARGKSIGDVAAGYRVTETNRTLESDMTWHDSDGVVYAPFASSAYRNFSGLGYRFERLKELLDEDIIGDGAPKPGSFLDPYVKLERTNMSSWLVPDIDHDSCPRESWSLDDEAATADWTRYLLTMAELVATNIPTFSKTSPFHIYYAQSVLPQRANRGVYSYLSSGGFPTASAVAGMSPYYDEPIGSIRGRKHDTLAKILSERSSGIDFTSMTNRPSSRVWWERMAFANSLLSCCSKLMLFWTPLYSPARTNEVPFVGRSPGFTFIVQQPSGAVSGEIRKETTGERRQLPLVTDRDQRLCYFHFNPKDYETTSHTSSNEVIVTTNYSGYCDSAYSDRDSSGSFSITVNATLTRDAFGEIVDVVDVGRYEVTVEFYADEDSFIPYPRMIAGGIPFCFWYGTTNWTSVVLCSYVARVDGNIPINYMPFLGPTQYESKAVDESKWNEFSCDPFVPHQMLFDSGVISSVSVHSYDVSAVSTNIESITSVSLGGEFKYTNAKDRGDEKKDCWAAFRQRVVKKGIKDQGSLTEGMRSAINDWGGGLSKAFGMSDIGDLPYPTLSGAMNVSQDYLSSILDNTGEKGRFVVSRGTGPKGGFDPGIDLVKDEDGLRLVWRTSGKEVKPDDILGIWEVEHYTAPITPESRKSASVHFETNPFMILDLDFKKMTYKKD